MHKQSFFEQYAHEYDALTNASTRVDKHRQEVAALIERFNPTRVLDAGCATGLTSSLFAEAGVATVGLDRSRAMLTVARRKFAGASLPLRFQYGRFEALPRSLDVRFDLIVCLANSITGVNSIANLKRSLMNFKRALKPGGALVIQLRNINAIKQGEIVPVRATQHDGILYLRYMERIGSRTILHIVRADLSSRPVTFEPFRNESENFSFAQIRSALRAIGWRHITAYSDLTLKSRFVRHSVDLVFVAYPPTAR
ncbi:MAG: methyltransferase domain-containing protein [Candidatus Zixiibacteriota bacterium]